MSEAYDISSEMMSKRTYKIVLLGDMGVGKTSIISRFASNKFDSDENSTVGVDFFGKNVIHEGNTNRLQLWDTSGNDRYLNLIPNYLKDAVCAIFVYDKSNPKSLQNLERWVRLFQEYRGSEAVIAFCANKSDLCPSSQSQSEQKSEQKSKNQDPHKEEVPVVPILSQKAEQPSNGSQKMLKMLCEKYKAPAFSVSAAKNIQIHQMFHDIIDEIGKLYNKEDNKSKVMKAVKKFQEEHGLSTSENIFNEEMIDKDLNTEQRFDSSREVDAGQLSGRDHRDSERSRRRKRRSKIKSQTIDSNQSIPDDFQREKPSSIWHKICPCIFK